MVESKDSRRVAVVIPAYNAAAFICHALESVPTDEGLAVRIVVVDDGSTDGTADIVRDWAAANSTPVVVLTQQNAGISVARNAAILASDEQYLAFLDADDRFLPRHLPALVDALVACPDAMLAFDDTEQFSNEGVFPPSMIKRATAQLAGISATEVDRGRATRLGEGLFTSLLAGNWIAPSSWVVPRGTFASCGLFDPRQRMVEDREFVLRASHRGPFVMVPQVGVRKRVHDANMTHPSNAEAFSLYALQALSTMRVRSDARFGPAIEAAIMTAARDLWYQASLKGQQELSATALWVRQLGLNQRPGARDVARAALSGS